MAPKNIFNLLGDDEAVLIFRYLTGPTTSVALNGIQQRQWVEATVSDYIALANTCKYLRGLMLRVDPCLATEMAARRTLDVRPLFVFTTGGKELENPYANQASYMEQERGLFKVLRKAETNLCFHCAGRHCARARKEVSHSGALVHSVVNSRVYTLSQCCNGDFAYVAMRTYDASGRAQDVIQLIRNDGVVNQAKHEYVLNKIEGFELAPNLMAAHPAGVCCAWTFEHEESNALYVMSIQNGRAAPCVQRLSPVHAMRYDGVTDLPGVCHAQGMWWAHDYCGDGDCLRLCVAWSTTLVAGSGHDMYGGAPVTPDERFVIGAYRYCKETFALEPDDFCGPYHGRLLTIKATRDGARAAAHVRRRPMHRWDMHYIAMTIDIHSAQAAEAKHPSIWKCKGKRRMGKDGFDWGPSAVGISPTGDALVCVHRTPGGVMMEVLDHNEGVQYTTTNSRDITDHFTSMDLAHEEWDNPFETGSSDDSESEEDYANKVKLPFDVDFTSSGSHACLVDRRPQFGSRAPRYSTVLVDISKRRQTKRMKALALYQERGSAVKGLHWSSQRDVWVHGRRGVMSVRLSEGD